eukprot:scaffold272675_cov31-Tisochrysis_lutea.AAC.11
MQSSRLYSSRLARAVELALSWPSGSSSQASYTTTDWSPCAIAVPRPAGLPELPRAARYTFSTDFIE